MLYPTPTNSVQAIDMNINIHVYGTGLGVGLGSVERTGLHILYEVSMSTACVRIIVHVRDTARL